MMSDLISRQNALDEIHRVYEYEFPTASGAFDEFVTVIIPNILQNLSSVDPERTAKVQILPRRSETSMSWEGKCSNCGSYTIHEMNYCFGCGAKLDWSE
jgi:hypothetical protein